VWGNKGPQGKRDAAKPELNDSEAKIPKSKAEEKQSNYQEGQEKLGRESKKGEKSFCGKTMWAVKRKRSQIHRPLGN